MIRWWREKTGATNVSEGAAAAACWIPMRVLLCSLTARTLDSPTFSCRTCSPHSLLQTGAFHFTRSTWRRMRQLTAMMMTRRLALAAATPHAPARAAACPAPTAGGRASNRPRPRLPARRRQRQQRRGRAGCLASVCMHAWCWAVRSSPASSRWSTWMARSTGTRWGVGLACIFSAWKLPPNHSWKIRPTQQSD
jgi:hypothetical protein